MGRGYSGPRAPPRRGTDRPTGLDRGRVSRRGRARAGRRHRRGDHRGERRLPPRAAGWRDVVLLEKGELTSGSTCQAAGLVTQFNPSPAMMRLRRYSIELYRELGVFETVGSLRIAAGPESLKELQRGRLARPRHRPRRRAARRRRGAAADAGGLAATTSTAPSGCPATATSTRTAPPTRWPARRASSASRSARRRASPASSSARGRAVRAVHTEAGRDRVRDRRQRGRHLGAAGVGDGRRLHAVDPGRPPAHRAEGRARATSCRATCRASATPTTSSTARRSRAACCSAGTRPTPRRAGRTACRGSTARRALPADEERFAALMAGAVRRFPFLADAGVAGLVCHPDAMTPDANPLLGPMPGVPGFWLAAGLSLNGFGGAGGIGRALAEWITTGRDRDRRRRLPAWRFGDTYRDVDFAAAAARETYRYYYRLRYPLDADELGRPQRVSALYGRLQEQGAVFGSKNGWERADYFQPGISRGGAPARTSARSAGRAAVPRPAARRAHGVPRARRHHRHDLVRQARGRGAGRAGAARARLLQPHRPARRRRRLHADARRAAAGSSPTSR